MGVFIGISISPKASSILSKFQEEFSPHFRGKTILLQDFHCTLMYLGDVVDVTLLHKELSKLYFPRFTVGFSHLGTFDQKILYAGLNGEGLFTMYSLVQKSVKTIFPHFLADHDFTPHITLARIKEITNKTGFGKALSLDLPRYSFEVHTLVLYKGVSGPDGLTYERLHEYTLQAPKKELESNYVLPPLEKTE